MLIHKILKTTVLAFLFSLMVQPVLAQQKDAPKGSLFIIGGGKRSPELIRDLIKTAGLKPTDYMIVLPMSSGEPEASFEAIKVQLSAQAANHIGNLNFTAQNITDKKWLDSLAGAKLIFITGGDQSRFMKVVLNTPVYDVIHKAYKNGATIAGTSAGAAVMSKYMITGKQLLDTVYKETFDKLLDKNIEFEQGLGLLGSVIIDQHFVKRNRYNRLISSLAAHPEFDCIGIDEGTAIVVSNKKIRVSGESQVLRITDPKKLKITANGHIKMESFQFNMYTDGDVFYIK
ncbi:cyanophycinase [Pedobacter metabolipauper]|uniref:Cyanophycinase n=1 Tax=Pedobacter metabolipauper TaxID=425513 RepID=A0A4R6STY8_9SPHI|nr:cyanophycinase [Pedobacter metabolipauper]TDQ07506.1 cyanophycinase [Pedobacter metabolipauper]